MFETPCIIYIYVFYKICLHASYYFIGILLCSYMYTSVAPITRPFNKIFCAARKVFILGQYYFQIKIDSPRICGPQVIFKILFCIFQNPIVGTAAIYIYIYIMHTTLVVRVSDRFVSAACRFYSLTSSGTAISASQASPVLSGVEAGSLDRGKAALERRNKKSAATGGSVIDDSCAKATGRVEVTRVNPDSLIDQLLRATNLDDHSADEDSKHSKFSTVQYHTCYQLYSGIPLFCRHRRRRCYCRRYSSSADFLNILFGAVGNI